MGTLLLSLTLSPGAFAAVWPPMMLEHGTTVLVERRETCRAVPAQVETWRGGRTAAQSLTFDDNQSSQVKVLIPMLNARGLRGTFFIVSSWVDYMIWGTTWDDWATVISEASHEIASHSVTHPYSPDPFNNPLGLTGLSPAALTDELQLSKERIRDRLHLAEGLTFAYPFAVCNAAVKAETANHYIAARAASGDTVDTTPADFFAIGSFSWQQGHTWQQMSAATNLAIARGEWAVDMIHGCDGEGWLPPPSTEYRQYFDHIKAQVDTGLLWVAPFGEVVRYIKERDVASVSVTADSQGVHTVSLTVSQNLPPGPTWLTVSFPVPLGWSAIEATDEGGAPVACEITLRGGVPHAIVDVMPEAPGQVAEVTVIEG